MPEWAKRALRTIVQAGNAGIVTAALVAFGWLNGEAQTAATLGVLTVLFAAAQNALEDAGKVPKLLR